MAIGKANRSNQVKDVTLSDPVGRAEVPPNPPADLGGTGLYFPLPWVAHNFDLHGRSPRAGLVAMITRCMVSHLPHGLHGCSTSLQTCNHRAIFGCVVVSPHLRRDKMVQLVHSFLNKNIPTQTIGVVFSDSLGYCSTSW